MLYILIIQNHFYYINWFILEGTVTDVSTTSVSSARSHCHNRCKAASVSNTFYAIRSSVTGFKCKCIDNAFTDVVVEVSTED